MSSSRRGTTPPSSATAALRTPRSLCTALHWTRDHRDSGWPAGAHLGEVGGIPRGSARSRSSAGEGESLQARAVSCDRESPKPARLSSRRCSWAAAVQGRAVCWRICSGGRRASMPSAWAALGALAPNGPNALSAGQAGAANGGALENRPGLGRPGAEPEELTRRLLFLLYLIGL